MIYIFLSAFLLVLFRGFLFLNDKRCSSLSQGDSMGHLNYVREYKRNGGARLDFAYLYILDGPDYPNGFHKLFYYLKVPLRAIERFGGLIPIVADLFLLLLISYGISLYGGEHYEWLLAYPFLRILYGNSGRAFHFSERAYGVFWANVYLFSVMAFYLSPALLWLGLALVAFCVFSISSKFAWQGSAFVTVLLSVLLADVYFIGFYVFCSAVAFVLTGGYAFQVLQGVIRHSFFYKTHLAPRNPKGVRPHYMELFQIKGLRNYIFKVFSNSPLRLITDNPLMLVFLALAFVSEWGNVWHIWGISGAILVLLISLKPFAFLGEPERYLEFTLLPVFVSLSFVSIEEMPFITFFSGFVLAIVLLFYFLTSFRYSYVNDPKIEAMAELKSFWDNVENAKVLSIPFRLSFFLGYENTTNQYVTLFSNIGKGKKGKDYRWLMKDRYPFVRGDLKAVVDRFGVDYFVVDKGAVEQLSNEMGGMYYDFSQFDVCFDNEYYSVYRVKS